MDACSCTRANSMWLGPKRLLTRRASARPATRCGRLLLLRPGQQPAALGLTRIADSIARKLARRSHTELVARNLALSDGSFIRLRRARDRLACAQTVLESVSEIAGTAADAAGTSPTASKAERDLETIAGAMRGRWNCWQSGLAG